MLRLERSSIDIPLDIYRMRFISNVISQESLFYLIYHIK